MPITLYRGDSRTPDQIRTAKGFSPWVITTPDTGRAIILRCIAPRGPAPKLPKPADDTTLQALLNSAAPTLWDVLRNIKNEKTRRTVHVSTDTSQDTGGYSSSYVYKMSIGLNVQALGTGAVTPVAGASDLASAVKANVFFDAATLAMSSLFGISGGPVNPGVEVAFLTTIPKAYITHYCDPGNTDPGSATRPWKVFTQ